MAPAHNFRWNVRIFAALCSILYLCFSLYRKRVETENCTVLHYARAYVIASVVVCCFRIKQINSTTVSRRDPASGAFIYMFYSSVNRGPQNAIRLINLIVYRYFTDETRPFTAIPLYSPPTTYYFKYELTRVLDAY